ncbi:receptor-type tyrosine-protein phosphatase T [Nephila pilipes]|uniref:protein-tyrosine-phosphatase n=1 Tax=Nephila pilipes TaxID=299642 RepID=A0A8X6ULL3_NEPPI|nr:receptor-type tyrosine-protein phosphatase T [Nephila pilipes]
MKKRFISKKDSESDFAVCNEALDEMDIIETESVCEDLSNPIPVKELIDFVKYNVKNNKIKKEFGSLPRGQIYPCSSAKMIGNKFKNRYGNILPYDHSRVHLNTKEDSNYIHANFIDGYKKSKNYIATQGPMADTISDFWLMIWNEKVTKIIMITNLVENGKCKCEKYWTDEVTSYGDIKLSLGSEESFADFIIRTFNISKNHKSREIKQFHFTSWPDHGVPLNTTPFINFLKKVRIYNSDYNAPVVVHCSAGIGRTGAVILFENSFEMAIHEDYVDVLGHLCNMRKQRMNIVENYDQFVFVYHALVEALCVEKTCIVSQNFLREYLHLIIPDDVTGITGIEKQFQILNAIDSQLLPKNILSAYMVSNQSKNRSMHILPSDKARPVLRRNSNGTDYINAVYIDSYKRKNKFVATQYPLSETVVDFWRMIFELKSKIIVLLQDVPLNTQNPQFWPSGGGECFGKFYVQFESAVLEDDIMIINLEASQLESQEEVSSFSMKLIQIKSWPIECDLPPELSTVLTVMKWINMWEKDLNNNIITVMCLDGVTACGVFCVSMHIIDRLKTEQEIDIFQSVKCTRTNRTQFITNKEQYTFLFQLTKAYLENMI